MELYVIVELVEGYGVCYISLASGMHTYTYSSSRASCPYRITTRGKICPLGEASLKSRASDSK